MSSVTLGEFENLSDPKYRAYVTAIDKALKNFEYSTEWPDLISALGKLNKVILGNMKYPVIPRRITISKRLAQCLHPALPSGVHLKALETYDIIFKCMGTSRLSHELFIYSAGLFPLLGHAATNVRPLLLTIYETHFVPLGERLRPALSGFLSGVLPGLEEGSDHFSRTNRLLEQVCDGVEMRFFYGCLWECVLSNSGVRLPALLYILSHFDRKLSTEDQLFVVGTDINVTVDGLCVSLEDLSVLVQRFALDLLLIGFPMHNCQLVRGDVFKLVTSAVTTLLRRDMSLNRRLFAWLLGSEVNTSLLPPEHPLTKNLSNDSKNASSNPYFDLYSKDVLIQSLRVILSWAKPQDVPDLRPYRLLTSLLDKPDIGPLILDEILYEVFRSLHSVCTPHEESDRSVMNISNKSSPVPVLKSNLNSRSTQDAIKTANLLFSTLEPTFIWSYVQTLYSGACQRRADGIESAVNNGSDVQQPGSGMPDVAETCALVDFLLDVVSLDTYIEMPTVHLPRLFCSIVQVLETHCSSLTPFDISRSLQTCRCILAKVQPSFPRIDPQDANNNVRGKGKSRDSGRKLPSESGETDSSSDNIDERTDVLANFCACYEQFFVTFVTHKILGTSGSFTPLRRRPQCDLSNRVSVLQTLLADILHNVHQPGTFIPKCFVTTEKEIPTPVVVPIATDVADYLEAFKSACTLLLELSGFPTYTVSGKNRSEPEGYKTELPSWLQVLLLCACYLPATCCELQFVAVSTFVELTALLYSSASNSNSASETTAPPSPAPSIPESPLPSVSSSCMSSTTRQGVVSVIIRPLLCQSHLDIIINETQALQTMARSLWSMLDTAPVSCHPKCVELLHQLNGCAGNSEIIEDVIGEALNCSNGDDKLLAAFRQFTVLWHLSREVEIKGTMGKPFERSLLKMLDNLHHPSGPLSTVARNWLLHSFLQGDVGRLLDPLLALLLDPATARASVLHVQICPSKDKETETLDDDMTGSTRIYAISSVDGNVIYHVTDDIRPTGKVSPDSKRFVALTTLTPLRCETHAVVDDSFASAYGPVSVFVNPLTGVEDRDSFHSYSTPDLTNAKRFDGARLRRHSSLDNVSSAQEGDSVEVAREILSILLTNVFGPEEKVEHPQTVANKVANVHPLHNHLLLYSQVYDSQRTLYALEAIRSILRTCARVALFAAATTFITGASSHHASEIQMLMARHRKSMFGKGFHGELSGEQSGNFRSSKYLEVIISLCLHFARSFYPNLGQMRLTEAEIQGNRQVQVVSIEVLSLFIVEMIPILRDSGRGFASYVGDVLSRCRVQKIVLHCLLSSVYNLKDCIYRRKIPATLTEEIIRFNEVPAPEEDPNKSYLANISSYSEAYQIELLKLLLAVIMLEDQVTQQKGEILSDQAGNKGEQSQTNRVSFHPDHLKYIAGSPITQQPMFTAAVIMMLKEESYCHLHHHWTALITSALPYMGHSLTSVVNNIVSQLCTNLEQLAKRPNNSFRTMPADYVVTQLETLTTLCHYCLLDPSMQISHAFPQPLAPSHSPSSGIYGANPSQVLNNLLNAFNPMPNVGDRSKDIPPPIDPQLTARRTLLGKMPRIIVCVAALWQAVANEDAMWNMCCPRVIRNRLLEFLSPIAHHHSTNFLAAVAVAWQERRCLTAAKKVVPTCSLDQQVLVDLVGAIRVMPMDTLVQTVHQVAKQPPAVEGSPQRIPLEVSLLQLFYAYLQTAAGSQLIESWSSLLALLRDGLTLSPPAQFLMLAILNEFVQRVSAFTDRKDQRDLQDVSAKLIEACTNIAGGNLEQTTWLRRNLAVKQSVQLDISEMSDSESVTSEDISLNGSFTSTASSAYSVQALVVLAELLAPLLDVIYGSDEKEKVIPLLTAMMHKVTPYLRNHSRSNIPSFRACSQLLANLSGYQYTRRAWKRDVFELLLDPGFFQMDASCIPYWKTIVDNMMTHDTTTFRDLLTRVSLAQTGSLNLFSNREQEYEQRSQLLKRLAFVIYCSEIDQYRKYMPDIQERLAESLRITQAIPQLQAQVFLCFRVLLLRMTSQHITSLWPGIISEMVQAFMHIEQELSTTTEEFRDQRSTHIKRLAALESSWVVNCQNGLHAHGNPAWLQLYLAACKLLDLALLLPAHMLPQFQMYRWAFVGDDGMPDTHGQRKPDFVPHVTRLAKLLDGKVTESEAVTVRPGRPLLTFASVQSVYDLYPFFKILSQGVPHLRAGGLGRNTCEEAGFADVESGTREIFGAAEDVLKQDFLENLAS